MKATIRLAWRLLMSRGSWHKRGQVVEPDAIDCGTMMNEIGGRFGLACKVEVKVDFDFKTVVVRAGTYVDMEQFEVVFQALYRVPVRTSKSLESMIYHTLWDIYQQADTGVAGLKPRNPYGLQKARLRQTE